MARPASFAAVWFVSTSMLSRLSSIRQSNTFLSRTFCATLPTNASKRVPTTAKSTKKYSDLPDVYTLPNGQLAAPLGPWSSIASSGETLLTPKSKTRKSRTRAEKQAENSVSDEVSPIEPQQEPVAAQSRSQLAREILANLERFPHCLLLTRVGSFYESYFDQASEIARLLNIKLTSRRWDGSRVPMCGFPLVHLDKYLKVLVQQHKLSVAMCEEFPRSTEFGGKEFDRRITRIISPGTLIDETFLEPSENNFLLAISCYSPNPSDDIVSLAAGLAWIDVSTGEFYSKECSFRVLEDELARINPKEVVLEPSLNLEGGHPALPLLKERAVSYTFSNNSEHRSAAVPTSAISSISIEAEAVSLLSTYLHSTLLEHTPSLESPLHETDSGRMQIDAHTIKALELRETDYEDRTKGSLLNVIKRTVTTGGTRLLSRRLCSPSAAPSEIRDWHSLISLFLEHAHLSVDLREILKSAGDIGRIVQKFTLRKGTIDDLIIVKRTIDNWTSLIARLKLERQLETAEPSESWKVMEQLFNRFKDLSTLATRIEEALVQSGLIDSEESQSYPGKTDEDEDNGMRPSTDNYQTSPEGLKWSINPMFSPSLSSLHNMLQELTKRKHSLEAQLQTSYNAPSLTLRSSAQQGMHIHISRAKRDQRNLNADDAFNKLSETASTKSYVYQPWSQLGGLIGSTTIAIAVAEKEAFAELIVEVLKYKDALKINAAVQDELDVSLGFATLARELKFTSPTITENNMYDVTNGRHPSVEMGLLVSGRTFTPNTITMTPSSNVHIITGPNMAGKSTVLRQAALIAVLAQIGSYVPADSATIGIVDKLFTRIGAKDDLFRDRSTFMVEMMETADILQRATPKSLVIMDEVGRGTTMEDGLAIAFAAIHHIITKNRSRCLFATHFHELSDMLGCGHQWHGNGIFSNVRFFCTDVDELTPDRFVYSYRLRPGINRDSHGLKVAQLAGLPPSALDVARKTLTWLKADDSFERRCSGAKISHLLQKAIQT